MTLSPRLAAIGHLIPAGSRVADVGTDHGYLPVWLRQTGVSPYVIATDIHPGPLEAAKRSAAARGVESGIDFRLADGLGAVEPDEVDTVVVAGMGGETIAGIIRGAPWLRGGGHRIVLQPQSKLPELSDWLHDLGYGAVDQFLVMDGGIIYTIYIVAPRAGERPRGGGRYVCPALLERGDPLLGAYLDSWTQKLERALGGLSRASGEEAGRKRTEFTRALEELNTWRGEYT